MTASERVFSSFIRIMQLPSYKKNSSKLIGLNLYITRNDQISSKSPNKKFRDLHTCRISTKLLLLTEV